MDLPNMTATEVVAAEKTWTEQSAQRASEIFAMAFEPIIDEMLRIAQREGFGIDPNKAVFIDDEGRVSVVDITTDAD